MLNHSLKVLHAQAAANIGIAHSSCHGEKSEAPALVSLNYIYTWGITV